jgi:allantoinase
VLAELEAIQRATLLAQETGCKLHIVHISSGRGVALAAEARARGVDVSLETCPHYLFFDEEDLERLGAVAKCAPPLRPRAEQEGLWRSVLAGSVDLVASDHSPSSPDLKETPDFFAVWGGVAGVQSTLAVLLEAGFHRRGLPLEAIARLTAHHPARRFGLEGKGGLEVGHDADLALVDLAQAFTLRPEDLFYRHKHSPYLGHRFRGTLRRTLLRGQTVFLDGKPRSGAQGRLVRPKA